MPVSFQENRIDRRFNVCLVDCMGQSGCADFLDAVYLIPYLRCCEQCGYSKADCEADRVPANIGSVGEECMDRGW